MTAVFTEYYYQIENFIYICAEFRLNKYSDDEVFLKCYFSHIEEKLKIWKEKKTFRFYRKVFLDMSYVLWLWGCLPSRRTTSS